MKVKLTLNGVPFGRTMDKDIAILYINQTTFALKGVGYQWVRND